MKIITARARGVMTNWIVLAAFLVLEVWKLLPHSNAYFFVTPSFR
ncbi:MAG: hypothetical protein Q8P59_01255 [Dehalococcoidia bacterium]|nr:hypothetical protein [Dehalococcoidia bacterium]